jgi:hypothetical protein
MWLGKPCKATAVRAAAFAGTSHINMAWQLAGLQHQDVPAEYPTDGRHWCCNGHAAARLRTCCYAMQQHVDSASSHVRPSLPVQVHSQRVVAGDECVDAQVKLLATHQVGAVHVALRQAGLSSSLIIWLPGVVTPPVTDLQRQRGDAAGSRQVGSTTRQWVMLWLAHATGSWQCMPKAGANLPPSLTQPLLQLSARAPPGCCLLLLLLLLLLFSVCHSPG